MDKRVLLVSILGIVFSLVVVHALQINQGHEFSFDNFSVIMETQIDVNTTYYSENELIFVNTSDYTLNFSISVVSDNSIINVSLYGVYTAEYANFTALNRSNDTSANFTLGNFTPSASIRVYHDGTENTSLGPLTPNSSGYITFSWGFSGSQNFEFRELPYQLDLNGPIDALNSSNNSIIFNATGYDRTTNMTCDLYIDGALNTSFTCNNATAASVIVDGLSEASHNWSITLRDAGGNTNVSETRNFTVDLSAPTFGTPTETGLSGTAVTITYSTNELTDTRVRYGTVTGTYTNELYNGANVTGHSVTLTSLSTSTTYYYVLNATDMATPDPNVAQSAEYSFTTLSGGVGSPGGGGGGPPLVTPEPEIIVVEPIISFLENRSEEFIRNNFFDDILGYSEAVNALVDFQDYSIPVAMFTVFGWEVGETIGVESEVANLLGAGVISLLVGGVYISRNWKVEFGGLTMPQKRENRRVKRDGILKGLSKARNRLRRDLGLEEERKKVHIRREKTMDVRRRNLQEKREMLAGRKKIVFKKKE